MLRACKILLIYADFDNISGIVDVDIILKTRKWYLQSL